MTRIGLVAALTLLTATAAYAQGQVFEPVVPRAPSEQRVAPSGVPQEEVPPQPVLNMRLHDTDADARHCLDVATNMEVHRCAEKYRSRALRTASSAKTPRPARVAKPADPVNAAK